MSDDDHLHSVIADYGDACAEMQAELDRLRKRVGELENKNSYNLQIVREATARIAQLEATILHWTSEVARLTQNSCDDQARAAETERDAQARWLANAERQREEIDKSEVEFFEKLRTPAGREG